MLYICCYKIVLMFYNGKVLLSVWEFAVQKFNQHSKDNNMNKSKIENYQPTLHQHNVSGSLIGKQIKWHGELQTIIDVHECGYVVMTDKSMPNGVNLYWDSVELLNCN